MHENIFFSLTKNMFLILWQKVFGDGLAPFRFLTPFSVRPSRLLRNSLRSNMLADRLICGLPQIGGLPRGYVPLVVGKVYTLPRRGGRESDRKRTPVGRRKAKLFPLQVSSTSLKDRTTKAKSSMVASSIPKDLFIHGKNMLTLCMLTFM